MVVGPIARATLRVDGSGLVNPGGAHGRGIPQVHHVEPAASSGAWSCRCRTALSEVRVRPAQSPGRWQLPGMRHAGVVERPACGRPDGQPVAVDRNPRVGRCAGGADGRDAPRGPGAFGTAGHGGNRCPGLNRRAAVAQLGAGVLMVVGGRIVGDHPVGHDAPCAAPIGKQSRAVNGLIRLGSGLVGFLWLAAAFGTFPVRPASRCVALAAFLLHACAGLSAMLSSLGLRGCWGSSAGGSSEYGRSRQRAPGRGGAVRRDCRLDDRRGHAVPHRCATLAEEVVGGIGTLLIWASMLMLVIGLAYLVMNAWWIRASARAAEHRPGAAAAAG